jgi:hypothetical protein
MRLIVGTGLQTACDVVTTGAHDSSSGTYLYAGGDGDGTVESRRALDGFAADAPNVKLLQGVTHGQLMSSPETLAYLRGELAGERLVR